MKTQKGSISVSAPGRICLFGEHQDYLGLPVITMAIDLRITIEGRPVKERIFQLDLPDIHRSETIDFSRDIHYHQERDYFRSGLNVLLRNGLRLPHGYACRVSGNIPINSGTSSSSALMVAWILFLLKAGRECRRHDRAEVARLAFEAEVLEFQEPGGMMDHFAASYGNILYINFGDPLTCEPVARDPGAFVLGDSQEPKDTRGILGRVKNGTLEAMALLIQIDPSLQINTLTEEVLNQYGNRLSAEQAGLLKATIRNRDLTQQALRLIKQNPDRRELGKLLDLHQQQLRDGLRISTPKIDGMIDAALEAGAFGAKINGSGGGGCMFAYAPDDTEAVAEAIERAGGIPYIIRADRGAAIESE